jgi:hypothetical protein
MPRCTFGEEHIGVGQICNCDCSVRRRSLLVCAALAAATICGLLECGRVGDSRRNVLTQFLGCEMSDASLSDDKRDDKRLEKSLDPAVKRCAVDHGHTIVVW